MTSKLLQFVIALPIACALNVLMLLVIAEPWIGYDSAMRMLPMACVGSMVGCAWTTWKGKESGG